MTSNNLHHIIIVGGGAGGLEKATHLGKPLGKKKKAQIALIDANRTHVWKPLLHEVAAGTFDAYENQIEYMAQAKINHFDFRLGKMNNLNRESKTVFVAPSFNDKGEEIIPQRQFNYDTLIIAVGSVSNDFGIEGVSEYCMFRSTVHPEIKLH